MAREFRLPDLGEGLTEAEIVEVLVREGDVIAEDTPLLEVETDKAKVEIPSPMGGRVETIHVTPGQTVKVGAGLVTFGDAAGAGAAGRTPQDNPRGAGPDGEGGRGAGDVRRRGGRRPRRARGGSAPGAAAGG